MGKEMQKLTDTEKQAIKFFLKILPYYYCLKDDVSVDIKFQLFLNHFINIPDACLWITKYINNKKVGSLCSKILNSYMVWKEINEETKENINKVQKYIS